MAIFIDSSVFCAYANIRDVHHKKAQKIIEEIASGKHENEITTDYIFDETVTVIRRKASSRTAVEIGKFLMDSEIFIAKIDSLVFQKAWELFQSSDLSFTDCSNLAFMELFDISKIATFDKGFKNIKGVQVVEN